MYAKNFKRCLMGLVVCLLAFSLCFSFYCTVLATEVSSSISSEPTVTTAPDVPSQEQPPQPSQADPPSSSAEASKPSSQAPSKVSSQPVSSREPSQVSSWQEPSQTSSEDVISQVSEGGAPDQYDEQYYNDGSYEYHGSYAGLSSKENSKPQEQPKKEKNKRSDLAEKYAQAFTIGMIVFGALSILMIVLLIYFNLKVKESKRLHPEWYRRKKRKAKRSKH